MTKSEAGYWIKKVAIMVSANLKIALIVKDFKNF